MKTFLKMLESFSPHMTKAALKQSTLYWSKLAYFQMQIKVILWQHNIMAAALQYSMALRFHFKVYLA